MKRGYIDVKLSLLALVSAVALSFGGVASAQIANSNHDLSGEILTGTVETCIFCHTPHTTSGLSPEAPLWNRVDSTETFTMYDSAISGTIDMDVASAPQGVSMGCLSCHDGATAYNALLKTTGQTFKTTMMSGDVAVGAGGDLTNDHPISVTYDPAKDPDFELLASVNASNLVRLFGTDEDQVECASCHDPHDDTNQPFMRAINTDSQICVTCHIK